MTIDFDELVRIDRIRDGERIDLIATPEQCGTIADRLGLPAIARLAAHAVLAPTGSAVRAHGRVQAALTQECVVTGEPIAAHVDAPFDLLFTPAPVADARETEVELGAEDCDTVFFDGSAIELGGAVADTLALSLDPFPRSAGADAALKDAGVLSEGEAGPFAALAALKGKPGEGA